MKQKALSLLWLANSFFQFFKSIIIGYLIMGFGVGIIGWAFYQLIKNVHQ